MASATDSIYELQRQMMSDGLHEEKRRQEAARDDRPPTRGRTQAPQPRARRAPQAAPGPQYSAPPRASKEGYTSGPSGFYLPKKPSDELGIVDFPPGSYRPDRTLEVHEILKHECFASSSSSCDDHFEKNRACPSAVYGVSDQYLILDSYEKLQESRVDQGEYKFNFMVQGVTRDQNIGVKDKLNTIIGIQVCDFCIPLLPFDDFDPASLTTLTPGLSVLSLAANGALPTDGDATTNSQSQTPFCSRVTLFLREIGLQSYSDADNRRHHFEFDATVARAAPQTGPRDRILLTPLDDCEYYLFTDPIQDVHGLTICFFNPGNVIRFPPDCLYDTAARSDAAQLLEFTYNDPTNLINLEVDDRIFIRGFVTGNSILDSYVTRPEGQLVGAGGFTVIPPTGPGTGTTVIFRLNPDVSVAAFFPANTPIVSAKQINVCIAKNRIRIPLRFRRVIGRLTNYIAP